MLVTGAVAQLTGAVSVVTGSFDLSDQPDRQVGIVSIGSGTNLEVDPINRAGRDLGAVRVTGTPLVDINDKSARELGRVSVASGNIDPIDRASRILGDAQVTGTLYPVGTGTEVFPVPKRNVFNTETEAVVATGDSFTGAVRDCLDYTAFDVSAFATATGTLFVDNSNDGITFRNIEEVAVNTGVAINREYAVTRRYMLIRYTAGNNNPDTTEIYTTQKPYGA